MLFLSRYIVLFFFFFRNFKLLVLFVCLIELMFLELFVSFSIIFKKLNIREEVSVFILKLN